MYEFPHLNPLCTSENGNRVLQLRIIAGRVGAPSFTRYRILRRTITEVEAYVQSSMFEVEIRPIVECRNGVIHREELTHSKLSGNLYFQKVDPGPSCSVRHRFD